MKRIRGIFGVVGILIVTLCWNALVFGEGGKTEKTVQPNLCPNSSFEVGLKDWSRFISGIHVTQTNLFLDNSAVHGKYSMKISKGKTAPLAEVSSSPIYLELYTPYTLSVYLKGDAKQTVSFGLMKMMDAYEMQPPQNPIKVVTVTNEWKRYVLPIDNLPVAAGSRYSVFFRCNDPGSIWVDGVKMEEGALSDYQPGEETPAIGVWTEAFGNLFHEGQKVTVKVAGYNPLKDECIGKIAYLFKDYYGNTVAEGETPVNIKSLNSIDREITLPIKNLGYYKGIFKLTASSGVSAEERISLGVIRVMPVKQELLEQAHFGAFSIANQLCVDVGNRWFYTSVAIVQLEPEKGVFDFSFTDYFLEECNRFGVNCFFNIANSPASWMLLSDIQAKGRNDVVNLSGGQYVLTKDYADLWKAVAARYKGKIKVYEILCERYFSGSRITAEEYAMTVKVASEAVKSVDPEARIMANFGGKPIFFSWMENFFKAGGSRFCDIVSLHPYRVYTESPEADNWSRDLRDINDLILKYCGQAKEVWLTEWGWSGEDNSDHPRFKFWEIMEGRPLEKNTEKKQADYMVRSIVMALGEGDKKFFYFLPLLESAQHGCQASMTRYDLSPKPSFVAYAVMTRFLDEAEFVEKLRADTSGYAYLFKTGTEYILVLWRSTGEGTVKIALPAENITLLGTMGDRQPIEKNVIRINEDPQYLIITGANVDQIKKAVLIQQ